MAGITRRSQPSSASAQTNIHRTNASIPKPPARVLDEAIPVTSSRTIARQLLDLAWPIIGLNTLSILALVIDTAMCGRLPEADKALTALGFASQLLFMLLIGMMGLTIGTVAIVACGWLAARYWPTAVQRSTLAKPWVSARWWSTLARPVWSSPASRSGGERRSSS